MLELLCRKLSFQGYSNTRSQVSHIPELAENELFLHSSVLSDTEIIANYNLQPLGKKNTFSFPANSTTPCQHSSSGCGTVFHTPSCFSFYFKIKLASFPCLRKVSHLKGLNPAQEGKICIAFNGVERKPLIFRFTLYLGSYRWVPWLHVASITTVV